jgi:hypothetical protein
MEAKKMKLDNKVRLAQRKQLVVVLALAMVFLLSIGCFTLATVGPAQAISPASGYSPEIGQLVSGKFLAYGQNNGGLAAFDYSITATQMEEIPNGSGAIFLTHLLEYYCKSVNGAYLTSGLTKAIDGMMVEFNARNNSYFKLGPVGTTQIVTFDDTPQAIALGQPLTGITIDYGNIVDSIQAIYGSGPPMPVYGKGGGAIDQIIFDPGDKLVEVSGYYGLWFGGQYILQLTLRTQKGRVYGPYGNMAYAITKTPFKLVATGTNAHIFAFFGSLAWGDNGKQLFVGTLGVAIKRN